MRGIPNNRRRALVAVFLLTAAGLLGALLHREIVRRRRSYVASVRATVADDVSRMNATAMYQLWDIPGDESAAQIDLRSLLARARADGLHVSIAGARHSMGGQTIAPGGIRINMLPLKAMKLDEQADLLHVDAGALWADVVPYLDRYGRSVAVMQSDNNFTVGGSLSVNCHGWQYGRSPIASTVDSFHLMQADGTVLRCSRTENKELFSLALGGYGLFGIILDADLHVAKNQRLRMEQTTVPLDSAMASFEKSLRERGEPSMFFARLDITSKHMFDDVVISRFYADQGPVPNLTDPKLLSLRRAIFRGSVRSEFGKEVRWEAETKVAPHLVGSAFSRNQLLNESTDWFLDRSDKSTDILQEYFLPREGAVPFLKRARALIQTHHADLLNVTVREVQHDNETVLRYADQPMIAFVMFFSQRRSANAEQDMGQLEQQLIDASLHSGGRYYLPYRLHASREQFEQAYPQATDFFRLKRKYDPDDLFENEFYLKYGTP